MIEPTKHGSYRARCDDCPRELEIPVGSFVAAEQYLKAAGWLAVRRRPPPRPGDIFADVCPDCAGKKNPSDDPAA